MFTGKCLRMRKINKRGIQNKCIDEFTTRSDTEQFYRRLRLRYHFVDKDTDDEEDLIDYFTRLAEHKESNRTPPLGESDALDLHIDKCRYKINNLDLNQTKKSTRNITQGGRKAIQSLKWNKDIIERADKGVAVVVSKKRSLHRRSRASA